MILGWFGLQRLATLNIRLNYSIFPKKSKRFDLSFLKKLKEMGKLLNYYALFFIFLTNIFCITRHWLCFFGKMWYNGKNEGEKYACCLRA